jgi:hypothetical protein
VFREFRSGWDEGPCSGVEGGTGAAGGGGFPAPRSAGNSLNIPGGTLSMRIKTKEDKR